MYRENNSEEILADFSQSTSLREIITDYQRVETDKDLEIIERKELTLFYQDIQRRNSENFKRRIQISTEFFSDWKLVTNQLPDKFQKKGGR